MKKKGLVTGALILTLANIISRILGFVYRIYMSNTIGSEGMGLYQLIMPIYSLAWSISASGFSTTVSKLVAQESAKKEYGNMGRILKQSFAITGLIGLIIGSFLFLFTDFIGITLLNDSRTILSLKLLSLCFPFMAAGSCIRGYFYGLQHSGIPASSQVLEQMTRMCIIYLLAQTLIPLGLEYACLAAVSGICGGEIVSFIYVVIAYKAFKSKNKLIKRPNMSIVNSLSSILSMAVPLTANRVVGSLLSAVENTLIPQKLIEFGYTSQKAISTYGEISGMAMPLLQFPTAFLVALSITLVPAVSEAVTMKNSKRVRYTVSKTLQFTFLIGIGVTSVFLAFPHQISSIIYKSEEIGNLLHYMTWLSPFLYLNIILSGILNGLGEQVFIFKINILSSIINILVIYFYIPQFGIYAFIVGLLLSSIVTSFLSTSKVLEKTKISFDFIDWILKPVFSIFIATTLAKYLSINLFNNLNSILNLIISLCLLGLLYIYILVLLKVLKKTDFEMFIPANKK